MSSETVTSAARILVPDIKPTPSKARTDLGVASLVLGDGVVVKAIGVVYGLEHTIRGDEYEAVVFLDHYNQRLRVLEYRADDVEAMVMALRALADANGFDKILVMASHDDWQAFLRCGYVLEAVLAYFHAGVDAFVVSKFRSQERLSSPNLMEETLLIEKIVGERPVGGGRPLPEGHAIRLAERGDVPALLRLYRRIFESYPSPLVHASYLDHVFQRESIFAVTVDEAGEVIAAASAELTPRKRAAELTDCATAPAARGKGLMSRLLARLEEELCRREYICAYTMARARSFGMNSVFHQLGYAYTGRLINNCDIYGAFEDMNIWVRDLRRPPAARPCE